MHGWTLPRRLAGALLAGFLALAPAAGGAHADIKPAIIAVVDLSEIVNQSLAGKGINAQLQSERESFQNETKGEREKLQAAEQELNRQRTILSKEAFTKRAGELQQQNDELQRTLNARAKVIEKALNEAMGTLQDAVLNIVAEVALEQQATMVVDKKFVIIADKLTDITATVLDRLNKKLPKVAVNIPKQ
jgi:outer membrane protein